MDFPCSECEYFTRCFPALRFLRCMCQQGRRKKTQTKITDFPEEQKTVT